MTGALLLKNVRTLITNPRTLKQYAKWKSSRVFSGGAPYVSLPVGRRLFPAVRFNDYVAIATQHPVDAEWRLVRDLLAEVGGGTFVDVGANVGAMSVLAHSTGFTSSILAFEPAHRYCEAWHRNMIANNVDNATLLQVAVGDRNGAVDFRVDPHLPLNGKIDLGKVHFSSMIQKKQLVTLDSILKAFGIESIALLKLDVEGAEPLVVRGAQEALKAGRVRSILLEFIVEFMEDMGEDPYEYVEMLCGIGFKFYAINTDGSHTEILNEPRSIVDSRRVPVGAPERPFEGINLVAKFH